MNIASKSTRYTKQICYIYLKFPQNPNFKHTSVTFFSSYKNRFHKSNTSSSKQTLNQSQFHQTISQLLPRFTPEDLHNLINQQQNPLLCLQLFNWASEQPRYKHDVSTFHITIKKLGRKLSKAVNVYKHMRSLKDLDCRPSIRTYNLLLAAFLSRRSNTYINYMYMDTMRMLFKQMVDDGIEPDIFALNCMIKGYVISLHVNDALRLYHQMGVVYDCRPNSFTFDYLIHGLCSQGRTCNARKICDEMKGKGFVPSSKSYNSLVSSLVIEGEVEEGVRYLWEMVDNNRSGDYIMYRTLVDELCKLQRSKDAVSLLKKLLEKRVVDRDMYTELLRELQVNHGNLYDRNGTSR
ncbi:pentatricopeptide repeat-containing protein At2g27800, mitochondrial-like [Rutidosis leptorrhynchoides]|uniref:pentatricopeptide repeat-containing protein At2g27800, mitochondrial-like n=1 Tax=Rutidosis leptorrhynchoides TaxID=125765 RepID=UPI003A98F90C